MSEVDRSVMPGRIAEAVLSVQASSELLNRDVMDVSEATFDEAAAFLKDVRAAVKLLQDSEQAIEAYLDEVTRQLRIEAKERGETFEPPVVEGVGQVEVKRGKDRKTWDHAGLGKAVLESLLADMQGEVPSPFQVRDALMDAMGISYWRVKELRRRDINVDDYCDTSQGKRSVIIT